MKLSFGRKVDYALIGLAHLAGNAGQVASAREIAETYGLTVSADDEGAEGAAPARRGPLRPRR